MQLRCYPVTGDNEYNEKRDFGRVGVECEMTFQLEKYGERYRGIARNLSATGMLVTTDKEVAKGVRLDVRVQPEESIVPPLEATVEVLRVDRLATGEYELGLTIKELKSNA